MNIIILGAGKVGSSLAELLSQGRNNVTVVDLNNTNLQRLQDRLDIATVLGHASDPDVLERANLESADILIAATQNDDTNLVACQIAHIKHKTPTKVARVRSASYLNHLELFDRSKYSDAIPINYVISPEVLVKNHIMKLIAHPGSLQVVDFAKGKVRLIAIKAYNGGLLAGKLIREIKDYHSIGTNVRIVAVYRKNKTILPKGSERIQEDDEVFFLAKSEHIEPLAEELHHIKLRTYRNIMIAGGGNIGFHLAKELENKHNVKIIEHNISQARSIAEQLDNAIIIQGDVSDKNLLVEENIDEIDIFIAVTNSDEANIISGMLAKKLGVLRVISLVNNQSYVELIQMNSIDVAISADQITTSNLLHLMHKGDTVKAFTLRRGAAEAMEVIVHGNAQNSLLIDKKISEIGWPTSLTIGCIVRKEEVLIAHKDLVIHAEDHLVLFLHDTNEMEAIEELFKIKENRSWF